MNFDLSVGLADLLVSVNVNVNVNANANANAISHWSPSIDLLNGEK